MRTPSTAVVRTLLKKAQQQCGVSVTRYIITLTLTKFLVGNTWLAQSVIVLLYVRVLVFLDSSVFLLFIGLINWCSCQCTVCFASPRGL